MADIRSSRRDADGQSVITASRLLDGTVVWRAADGSWSEQISQAQIVPNPDVPDLLDTLNAHAQQSGLIGIYGVQVAHTGPGDSPVPVTARERIRAYGPSIHPEFAPGAETAEESRVHDR